MDSPLTQLSVKVDTGTRDKLEEKARGAGTTLSDYVRRKLREDVSEDSDLAKMRLRLTGIERKLASSETQVLELRRDLAASVEVLMRLVSTNASVAPDEIKAWVDKNLRQKG